MNDRPRIDRRTALGALAAGLVGPMGVRAQEPTRGRALREAAEAIGWHVGAAVFPQGLDQPEYATTLAREFDALTPENALKWGPVHPEPDRWNLEPAERLVRFAAEHGMSVKGHALVWHSQLARYAQGLEADALRGAMLDHIGTLARHFRGKIAAWDVVNEALDPRGPDGLRKSVFLERLGPGFIAEAFRAAHEADPDARLIYNDYGCEGRNPKSARLIELIRQLRTDGVPVHEVGLQMHVGVRWAPRSEELVEVVRQLVAQGVTVNVSEMDVSLKGVEGDPARRLEQQAETYERVLRAYRGERGFRGVTFWGFTDRYSWLNRDPDAEALLFDRSYRPKPAYGAVLTALESRPG